MVSVPGELLGGVVVGGGVGCVLGGAVIVTTAEALALAPDTLAVTVTLAGEGTVDGAA